MNHGFMPRLNLIYNHPLYKRELSSLVEDERNRNFCKHGLEHLMDVARLCVLFCAEDGLIDIGQNGIGNTKNLTTEIIYAAALLHDIGRHAQYSTGEPHDKAGVRIAEEILENCGFCESEMNLILSAISSHRENTSDAESTLATELRRADKESRLCFACPAIDDCNWPDEKKNMTMSW